MELRKKMKITIPPRPFVKRKPNRPQGPSLLSIINDGNVKKRNFRSFRTNFKPRNFSTNLPQHFDNNFTFTNIRNEGDRIPKTIITNDNYKKYNYKIIKELDFLETCKYLYENGGIRLNGEIKTHPCIFIKNTEMMVHSIDFFSCEKGSPIMKKIIDEGEDIVTSFNTNTYNIRKNLDLII